MIKGLGLFIFILLSGFRSMAVDAVLSHSVFYVPDPIQPARLTPAVDAYWQIKPQTLHYTRTPEKTIIARIKTEVFFSNESGVIKEDHYIMQTTPRANVSELSSHSIIELHRYLLPPGFVHMKLKLTDMGDSTNPFTLTDTFTILPGEVTPFFSSLQLLDTVIEATTPSPFKKNGRQQIPQCVNFIDDGSQVLHYYTEMYEGNKIPKENFPLVQKVIISRSNEGDAFGNFIKTDSLSNSEAFIPLSGSFEINTLPSGNYYLIATLENKAHEILAFRSLFFQRLNKHPAEIIADTIKKTAASDTGIENVTVLNLKKTFVAKYSLGELRAILKMLLPFSDPVATQTIRNFLKKPDELYMRYYVYNYFTNINKKDPGKAFKEFSQKIIEVNKLYTSRGVPGYETDRGVIYLKYGAPTDIITVENENGSLPYEIWQYNVLEQTNHKEVADAYFLFYKQNQATSDFRILHSTVEAEAKNMDWRSYLYPSGRNGDSRAEQYIGNK